MYYPNDAAAAAEPNSTPHVDSPGLVTAIPVAGTPGLRVRDRATGDVVEAERLYRPHADVVVFVDAALQALSRGRLRACTHDVAKGPAPRLSLVYELRPAMAVAADILAPQGRKRRRAPDPPPGD